MTEQQITDEAIKYCSCIDFTDDKNLSEKGRDKVREWSKQDFIAGAKWMQEQLCLSNISQQSKQLFCDCKEPNFINISADNEELYCSKCELPIASHQSRTKIIEHYKKHFMFPDNEVLGEDYMIDIDWAEALISDLVEKQANGSESKDGKLSILHVSSSLPSDDEIETKAKEIIPEDLYKDCGGFVTIEDRNKDKRRILIEGINIGVRWRQ